MIVYISNGKRKGFIYHIVSWSTQPSVDRECLCPPCVCAVPTSRSPTILRLLQGIMGYDGVYKWLVIELTEKRKSCIYHIVSWSIQPSVDVENVVCPPMCVCTVPPSRNPTILLSLQAIMGYDCKYKQWQKVKEVKCKSCICQTVKMRMCPSG